MASVKANVLTAEREMELRQSIDEYIGNILNHLKNTHLNIL